MSRKDKLRSDPLPWLLEEDKEQPGVRYFALRDIMRLSSEDAELKKAQKAVMDSGPVPVILAAQNPEGYWVKPGVGYGPKYKSTVWSLMFLAQLGADGNHPAVRAGCEYSLANGRAGHGGFTPTTSKSAIFIHCLGGNLGAALQDLGWGDDERLAASLDWQARLITGEGVEGTDGKEKYRYYKSGTCGPEFACSANNKLPCAWGGVKAMVALGKVTGKRRTPQINAALEAGANFLLSRNPAVADYPMGYAEKPNLSWFKFGYPTAYVTDVLQTLEALVLLGKAKDSRLADALELVTNKQDENGRWPMEYTYNHKTWVEIENKRKPSKWVTLRALRVLKAAYPD